MPTTKACGDNYDWLDSSCCNEAKKSSSCLGDKKQNVLKMMKIRGKYLNTNNPQGDTEKSSKNLWGGFPMGRSHDLSLPVFWNSDSRAHLHGEHAAPAQFVQILLAWMFGKHVCTVPGPAYKTITCLSSRVCSLRHSTALQDQLWARSKLAQISLHILI